MYGFKLYGTLTYFNFLITQCVLISAFAFLISIPICISSSAIGLKICKLNAGIKKYKSTIKKKKHDEIVLLAKTKLNTIEVLVSRALINLYISYDEFV